VIFCFYEVSSVERLYVAKQQQGQGCDLAAFRSPVSMTLLVFLRHLHPLPAWIHVWKIDTLIVQAAAECGLWPGSGSSAQPSRWR
jgi:hypothetical protein